MANKFGHECDFIVVGQGLAGTCLSYSLHKQGKKVLVIDRDMGRHCSSIAAGTINPVVFKTYTSTWKAEILLPFLHQYYAGFGTVLGCDLIAERPIIKLFRNGAQRDFWLEQRAQGSLSPYMGKETMNEIPGCMSNFGACEVMGSGSLKMDVLLSTYRKFLLEEGRLREENFALDELKVSANSVEYGNIRAEGIVFCQGHENSDNHYFEFLQFKYTKGELLIIHCPGLKSNNIVHNGINVVPLGEDRYWVGATFDWNDIGLNETDEGLERLQRQLEQTISCKYEVIDRKVGIRPTVIDRRPILGKHPEFERMGIFNGLGTRGVMLAPYFAEQMTNHLLCNGSLDREVDLRRFIE